MANNYTHPPQQPAGGEPARDLIADIIGEGCDDLPDETEIVIHIGKRGTHWSSLGMFRAALSPTTSEDGRANTREEEPRG